MRLPCLFYFWMCLGLGLNCPSLGHAQDLTSGLVSWITFNGDNFSAAPTSDAGGTFISFADHTGQGNPATCYRSVIVRGVSYPMDQCPRQTTGPDGSVAAEFSGTLCDVQSDHLGIANAPELDKLRTGTISLWVLYHQFASDGVTEAYRNTRLINTFHLGIPGTWYLGRDGTTSNMLKVMTDAGLEQRLFYFPDTNLYSGEYETWNHLTVTWDGSLIKGYFNGTFFKEVPQTRISTFNLGTYITLGALNHSDPRNSWDGNCVAQYGGDPAKTYVQPNTGFLGGAMDDIRIYNRALSASEVQALSSAPNKRPTFQLRVLKQGNGHGFVSSSRGISCGASCAEAYRPSTKVTLTASAWSDSSFTGWSGPCSGTGTCTVTLGQNVDVGATFTSNLLLAASTEAEAARVVAPFVVRDGLVVQPGNVTGTPTTGGRWEFDFALDEPTEVLVLARVNAPDTGSDSFFINFDTIPESPGMVWDIWSTAGLEDRLVRWRGTGDSDHPEFNPKWFPLSAGQHKLIIIGRESGAQLDSVQVLRRPGAGIRPDAPTALRVN